MHYKFKDRFSNKMKNKSIISIDNTYKEIKSKYKNQILEVYLKKRKKDFENNLSKLC